MQGSLDKVRYVVYDKYGRPRRCRGGHFLVDGGYQKFACFIPPQRWRGESASIYWSECAESARKDVECVFGILKARFRMLSKALEFNSAKTIENIMKCCCMLHNILLIHDGLDSRYNDKNFWEQVNPDDDSEEVDLETYVNNEVDDKDTINLIAEVAIQDFTNALPGYHFSCTEVSYEDKVNVLINHHEKQFKMGLLQWPKSFNLI
jgi:hypothetical protein